VDVGEFLGLEATHNPHRWYLPVAPGLATLGKFLFGGAGLGASILALERTTERPVVWATAQYLSYAMIGEIVDLDVTIPAAGRNTAQARVVGRVGDREILTVNAALGERELDRTGQWTEMPDVPAPDDCVIRESTGGGGSSIMSLSRAARRSAKVYQLNGDSPRTAGLPCMPARRRSVGGQPGGARRSCRGGSARRLAGRSNSFDNLWVTRYPDRLGVVDAHPGQHHGFGHGDVYQWSSDGTLMARQPVSHRAGGVRAYPGQAAA
jgi:hypothetical protein